MAGVFDLNIITSEKEIYKGKAESLIVPAASGYLGILHDHAPLMGLVAKGLITIREAGAGTVTLDSPGEGFFEVSHNRVTVLLGPPA